MKLETGRYAGASVDEPGDRVDSHGFWSGLFVETGSLWKVDLGRSRRSSKPAIEMQL
jgi:hypothetical protein